MLFLHPGYWGGHYFGDADAQPTTLALPKAPEWRATRKALRAYTARAASIMALASYNAGEYFAAAEQTPDTVVALDVEYLATENMLLDPAGLAGVEPPVRTPVYYGSPWKQYHVMDFWYYHFLSLSAVAQPRPRKPAQLVGHFIGGTLPAKVLSIGGLTQHPPEIEVGAVTHEILYERTTRRMELLRRVNRIDLLALGKTQTRRAGGWFGALRPRENPS